jgi:hypothetical protein
MQFLKNTFNYNKRQPKTINISNTPSNILRIKIAAEVLFCFYKNIFYSKSQINKIGFNVNIFVI